MVGGPSQLFSSLSPSGAGLQEWRDVRKVDGSTSGGGATVLQHHSVREHAREWVCAILPAFPPRPVSGACVREEKEKGATRGHVRFRKLAASGEKRHVRTLTGFQICWEENGFF